MVALFAAACGLSVANIYYTQPLIDLIAPDLGLPAALAGLIVALTQLGYGAGLLLLVPLADVTENRRLVLRLLAGVVLGLLGIALARSATVFLLASAVVGICAVATQVLVPLASQLTPEAKRGRVVGNVMGGLLAGIMLARPFASFVADALGWRAVFWITAALMAGLLLVLRWRLPRRDPGHGHYGQTLASLPGLFARTPLLRRRALYQGMMFAAFNFFWTAVPLLLAHAFHFDQRHIAVFALAGAAGALAAPLAGRLADHGWTRVATGVALAVAVAAFALAGWAGLQHRLAWLVVAALLLDAAVQVCQVLSLRSIYMLAPDQRGRLNGLFMTAVFVCGAFGSALAAAIYVHGGWGWVAVAGAGCAAVGLAFYATEFRRGTRVGVSA
jgi:predicted MFS family arabinose efflux permease